MSIRPSSESSSQNPTREGAGVHLRRAFGFGNTSTSTLFSYLTIFPRGNDVPEDYQAVPGSLAGSKHHHVFRDGPSHAHSHGNQGAIAAGDRCSMTPGQWASSTRKYQRRSRGPHARVHYGATSRAPQ